MDDPWYACKSPARPIHSTTIPNAIDAKPKYRKYLVNPQTRKIREHAKRTGFEENGVSPTKSARDKNSEARQKHRQLATAFTEKSCRPKTPLKPSATNVATWCSNAACLDIAFEWMSSTRIHMLLSRFLRSTLMQTEMVMRGELLCGAF